MKMVSVNGKTRLSGSIVRDSFTSTLQTPSVKRVRQLVKWLGLSIDELSLYCNRAVPVSSLFRILNGRQPPSSFERKALSHAIARAVQERSEILFEC